ncbi:MAG: hypothetical protein JSS70_04300 [Bacteroidetes bacterium]|nr:hypothetical protein [Bacteroidota bacterium]
MNYNDIIGTIGVGLILLAYFGNTFRLIKNNSAIFFTLNMIGGALATCASFLIHYWPFVILEGTWFLVSLIGLLKTLRTGRDAKAA